MWNHAWIKSPSRLERMTSGNGIRSHFFYDGLAGSPNAPGDFGVGQISRIRHAAPGANPVIDERTFSHDPGQNLLARADIRSRGPGLQQEYSYDERGRHVGSLVTRGGTNTLRETIYARDLAGNRTQVTGDDCAGPYQSDPTTGDAVVDPTVGRSLGLPCRPVTNFNSAHEERRGIIKFTVSWSDATGHFDLWDGTTDALFYGGHSNLGGNVLGALRVGGGSVDRISVQPAYLNNAQTFY